MPHPIATCKALVSCTLVALMMPLTFAQTESPDVIRSEGVVRIRLLPPGPDNPRNSEGDFIKLRDGRLLFVYTKFTGGGGDHSRAHLAGRFSQDEGLTWSDQDVIVLPNEGRMNIMSVSLLRLRSGQIALLYLRKDALDDCRLRMRVSTDEAATWSDPVLCMPDQGYYVVNNDRVIQLGSGRLVAPAARHNVAGGKWTGRGVAMCFLSDDDGKTWRQSNTAIEAPTNVSSGLQEPGVIELKDGRLMMLCRTNAGCQMRSWSADGGETWSPIEKTSIISPLSPATFERIPKTGDILLVWNDHSQITDEYRGKRTPFNAAISRDEGLTWEKVKTLEDDPAGWYCYTAMEFAANRVLLGHCAGGRGFGHLNRTQITLVDIDWLYR